MTLRLFPALGLALGLVLTLKAFEIASGLSAASAEDAAHAPPPAAAAPATSPAPAPAPAAQQGELSRSEVEVLQSLSQRRTALDAREQEIATREGLLAAAEKRVEERIAELKSIEAQITTLLGARDAEEEKQLAALVKTYETMKPAEAARIFERMEQGLLVQLTGRMKPARIAPVMAQMDPAKAKELTVALANRLTLPAAQTAQAVPETAPEADAPVAETPAPEAAPAAPTGPPPG